MAPQRSDNRGFHRHGRARHGLPRRGLVRRLACATADAAEAEPRAAAAKPVCLNAAETREEVKSRHLIEPFAALKFAAAQRKAEALSAKLCHTGDDFVYEITLLHRDGRLVHVEMEAATGKCSPARAERASRTRRTIRRSRTDRGQSSRR